MPRPGRVSLARPDDGRRTVDPCGLAFGSIVHVNEKGGCFGGTEEYVALLTAELVRREVRSHLVCGVVTGELPPGLGSVHVLPGLASRHPRPGTGEELVGVIERIDADVVYLHNVFDPAAVAALAALPGRRTVIWYVHDHYLTCLSELRWRRDRGSCRERLGGGCLVAIDEGRCVLRHPERSFGAEELQQRLALSGSLGEVDAVVVVSEYMRSLLVDAQPHLAERIHLVPRPIRDLDAPPPRHRKEPGDRAVVTFAGRITPEKGLAILIEAMGSLRGVGPIELRIAGIVEHQAYGAHCQLLQQRAIDANPCLSVTHLGQLDYSATDELLRQSDIVAVPSQWPEPLGAVALEAMMAAAAVVASNIGGLDTHLVDGHTGLLVDPPDVAAWTAAIQSLLRYPDQAHHLGLQAHRRVRHLTTGAHLSALNDVIRRARSCPGAPSPTQADPRPRE